MKKFFLTVSIAATAAFAAASASAQVACNGISPSAADSNVTLTLSAEPAGEVAIYVVGDQSAARSGASHFCATPIGNAVYAVLAVDGKKAKVPVNLAGTAKAQLMVNGKGGAIQLKAGDNTVTLAPSQTK